MGIKPISGSGLLSQARGFSSLMRKRTGVLSGIRGRSSGIKGVIGKIRRGGRVRLATVRPVNTRYRGIRTHLGRSIDLRA
jgi:hypothetical protein